MSTKICYLVIEGTEERELLETAIRETELGYVAISAKSIERAKERFRDEASFSPDYVFIDWNVNLLSFIRAIPHLANTPVIVYATEMNTAAINEARRLGATHCMLKTTHEIAMTKVLLNLFESKVVPFVLVYPADDVQSSFIR